MRYVRHVQRKSDDRGEWKGATGAERRGGRPILKWSDINFWEYTPDMVLEMFCCVGIEHQLNSQLNSPCSNEVAQNYYQRAPLNMSLCTTIFAHCSLYQYTILSKPWYMTTVSHSPTTLADLPDLHERKIHQGPRLWPGARQADDRRK